MVMMTAGEKTWQQKSQVLTGKLARRRRKILKIGAQNAFLVREISSLDFIQCRFDVNTKIL